MSLLLPATQPLLDRWLFVLVRVGADYLVPYTDAAWQRLRASGEYPAEFLELLERLLQALLDPAWPPGNYYPGGWFRALQAAGQDVRHAPIGPEALAPFFGEEVRVDRRGHWWVGAKMMQGAVLRFFASRLEFDEELRRYRIFYPLEARPEARYIHHQAVPLRVLTLDSATNPPQVLLNDGTQEPLDWASLRVDGQERLYCAVRPQRLPACLEDTPRWLVLQDAEPRGEQWLVRWKGQEHVLALHDPWPGAAALQVE